MSILYFTTTNKGMYDFSGKKMLRSFKERKNEGDKLYVFHEEYIEYIEDEAIEYVNTKDDEMYMRWFNENKDIIPKRYKGLAEEEDERLQIGKMVKWNQKACLWFWKIVAMNRVLYVKNENYKMIVLLDIDTEFKEKIEPIFWKEVIDDVKCCGYHLGKHRGKININMCAGVESGIMVFRNDDEGKGVMKEIVRMYMSGEFRRLLRWDDGYIIRIVVSGCVKAQDLTPNSKVANVIAEGPFKGKIAHYKGVHWKRNL